ncbi:TRAP transporter small permease [Salinarimonas chemoclinalis]|uniref:TRAP transporter small permease n=1 Tax=Salinarimonas chemoclinalis TaxID=3241599 RepID=UPI003557642D
MTRTLGRAVIAASDGLDRMARALTVTFLCVLVVAVMIQVVARYVFASPPAWTEELARYAMIWAGLMGATMSFKRRFDPAMFQNPRPRLAALAVGAAVMQSLVVLVYLLPILWHSVYGPGMNFERGFLLRHARMTASTLDVPTLFVAIAVPLMVVVILVHLAARWCGDPAGSGESAHDADG